MWSLLLVLPLLPAPSAGPSSALRNTPAQERDEAARLEAVRTRLREALRGDSDEEKVRALTAAQKLADGELAELALDALREDAHEVRAAALEVLRWNEHASVLPALHRLLQRDRDLRKDEVLATALVKAIGQHADPSSVELLAKNPFATPGESTAQARLLSLGRIRTRASVEALIGLLRGTSKKTRTRFRDAFRLSLVVLTGTDLGTDDQAWIRWWNEGGKELAVSPTVPTLPQRLEVRWYSYWGLERPGRNVERREDRGRDGGRR